MKDDFLLARSELSRIGICRICADFYKTPTRIGTNFFVPSPQGERTPSLCIFPKSNTFKDFSTGEHGDIIGFVSYVCGIDNWKSLQRLRAMYSLSNPRQEKREEIKERICREQARERQKRERVAEFWRAWRNEVDELKYLEAVYRCALEKNFFEPLSELWTFAVRELEKTQHKLDVLCAADTSYMRLKPAASNNLPSDRPRWLLDILAILREDEKFEATVTELKMLKKQRGGGRNE